MPQQHTVMKLPVSRRKKEEGIHILANKAVSIVVGEVIPSPLFDTFAIKSPTCWVLINPSIVHRSNILNGS